jgi:hypothetical protein
VISKQRGDVVLPARIRVHEEGGDGIAYVVAVICHHAMGLLGGTTVVSALRMHQGEGCRTPRLRRCPGFLVHPGRCRCGFCIPTLSVGVVPAMVMRRALTLDNIKIMI